MNKLSITISEQQKQYPIFIGANLIEKIPSLIHLGTYTNIVIITDEIVGKLFLHKVKQSFPSTIETIILPSGEKEKNINTVQTIWRQLLQFQCDRKSLVINLGGGVIGDMGGFAASTYMRGIDFLQIPTTLLSIADASIGGKTGINFGQLKNTIGTFQQPVAIIIDTEIVQTLPKREFLNGFAEIIKQGLIQDKEYFYAVTAKAPKDFSTEELIQIITRSCKLKANLVMQDETEQGIRKILNFGHTIGHAIETLSLETESPLRHGEAVHIGMLVETAISYLTGLLPASETQIIQDILQKTGLPTTVKGINVNLIVNKIVNDKKNTHGEIKWVLLKHIGEAVYDQQVPEDTVRKAIETVIIR